MVRIVETRYLKTEHRLALSGWSNSETAGVEDLLEALEVEVPQLKGLQPPSTKTEDHVITPKPVKGMRGPGRPKTKVPISKEKTAELRAKIAKAVETRRKRK